MRLNDRVNTLYLDIFSGLSGDMFLGACVDLGVDARQLEYELAKLDLEGYQLRIVRAQKFAIEGVKFDVLLSEAHAHEHTHAGGTTHSHAHTHGPGGHEHGPHDHDHGPACDHGHGRTFADIRALIHRGKLSNWVKEKAVAVFHRIAVAEGKIHGLPPEHVHFHEVGAVDSIVDIVGVCIALEMLGKPRVLAGTVVEGTGFFQCAHGRFPLPAPATLEILGARGAAISQCDEPAELLTPTGAALLAEFAESFGPMRDLVASRVGYGLGTRDNKTRPNVVRAVLGEVQSSALKVQGSEFPAAPSPAATDASHDWETDTIAVLETNLDDCSGEVLGHFVELALASGALDAIHTPIQMKKNRPGVQLTVLCAAADADKFSEMLLRETSAFGVRRTLAERRKLQREVVTVTTPFGEVAVKLGKLGGKIIQASPEFESCKQAAAKAGVPLKQVFDAAVRAATM
jgi:uncharacterized protein (TIGR00299 family) protein